MQWRFWRLLTMLWNWIRILFWSHWEFAWHQERPASHSVIQGRFATIRWEIPGILRGSSGDPPGISRGTSGDLCYYFRKIKAPLWICLAPVQGKAGIPFGHLGQICHNPVGNWMVLDLCIRMRKVSLESHKTSSKNVNVVNIILLLHATLTLEHKTT